jgi:hypothetical protein
MSAARFLVALLAAAIGTAAAQEPGVAQAAGTAARTSDARDAAGTVWLMAAVAPGLPDRLSVFRSDDGARFVTQASEAYAPPRGMLRDPALIRHDGAYWVAYAGGAGREIGLARSADLKHWTFVRAVPMPGRVRAPRWLRTRDGGVALVVALARDGAAAPFQPWLVEADAGLAHWSAPRPLAGLQDAYEDAAVARDGDGYVALARRRGDGVPALARAPDPAGPWTVERAVDAFGPAAAGADLVRIAVDSKKDVEALAAGLREEKSKNPDDARGGAG